MTQMKECWESEGTKKSCQVHTHIHASIHTNIHTHRQTDIHACMHADRQTDRQDLCQTAITGSQQFYV